MAERKVVTVSGISTVFSTEFKDRDTMREAKFTGPSRPEDFAQFVGKLSTAKDENGDSDLSLAWEVYLYGAAQKSKMGEREQVAAESTVIKRDGKELDLMAVAAENLEKAVGAINHAIGLSDVIGPRGMGAFLATRKKLAADGRVRVDEKDGTVSVAK